MKFLTEYRNSEAAKKLLDQIHQRVTHRWMIMEICGGQTHSLVKNGILDLLPKEVVMVHGPGCPVCVTPISLIDQAVELSETPGVTVCSFGDMIRVPGTKKSLMEAKADGGSVKIVYSPLDSVQYAREHPNEQVVFFAVGFETTAPANALAVIQANRLDLDNFSLLVSHVLVPPAMEAILGDEFNQIQAFLAAGHVCTVMGYDEYFPIAEKYKIPIVVSGFEPVDLLQGIARAVDQLESGKYEVENQYSRVVSKEGNLRAKEIIFDVFEIGDRDWRGIGTIPDSGYVIKPKYAAYDATRKFSLNPDVKDPDNGCIAGEIMKGRKKPFDCPHFGKDCNPINPLGAPMVSSEGACAAYYNYARVRETATT